MNVLEYRAKYRPLTDVEVTISHNANGRKTRTITKRCAVHATLWDNLTEPQQEAAEHIYRCHAVIHGSPSKAADLTRMIMPRGQSIQPEIEQARRADYFAWQSECLQSGIDFRPAVLVCAEGASISELSRQRTRRRQMTAALHEALDVMATLKGWK